MRPDRLVSALTALLLVMTLAACSHGDDEAPDQAWLEPALLTVDDLGGAFEAAPDDDDDDDDDTDAAFGCLLDFDLPRSMDPLGGEQRDDDGPEAEFQAVDEPNMPLVFVALADTGNESAASGVLDAMAQQSDDCTEVDVTRDGMRWQFQVESDTETWAPGSHQQLSILASGSGTQGIVEVPMSFALTIVRSDDVLVMSMFVDMAADIVDAHHSIVTRTCERLQALVHEEPLPEREPLLDDYPVGEGLEDLLGGTPSGPDEV